MWTPDQFAKNALREALRYVSATETEVEVIHATQKIDVYASPDPTHAHERAQLGLLGELAEEPTLFEAFWNTPSVGSVRRCLAKQLAWHHELERRARVDAKQVFPTSKCLPKVVFPWLVILVSGRPNSALDVFACQEVRPGIYEAAAGFCLRIVVIGELPRTRETLLLRLFARGRVFEEAIADFDRLPEGTCERRVMAPLLNAYTGNGKDDAETNEEVPVTFAEQLHALAQAHQRSLVRSARTEAEQAMLLRQLQIRFGNLPTLVEERVREANHDDLYQWAERILQATTLDQVFGALPA